MEPEKKNPDIKDLPQDAQLNDKDLKRVRGGGFRSGLGKTWMVVLKIFGKADDPPADDGGADPGGGSRA